MAPEMLEGYEYDLEKSDVFACAVILFSMLYGMPPYLHRANAKDPYYKFFTLGR